jgi:hypothetical protein
MAHVFSPEIEALLEAGPPVINWDDISEQLRKDFVATCGDRRPGLAGGSGTGVPHAAVVRAPGSRPHCDKWVCLVGRNVTCDTVAVAPTVVAGTGQLADLVHVGSPWLTFSVKSVAELNSMGVDEAYSVHGTVGRACQGAVVYRGSTDSDGLVQLLAKQVFSRVTGPFKYVTAWSNDTSRMADAVAHLFGNGGKVCGADARGSGCDWCDDTGRVTKGLQSYGSGAVVGGDYCLCSRGEWLETRDDEDNEWEYSGHTTHLMGRPSPATPPRSGSPSRTLGVDLSDRMGGSRRDAQLVEDVLSGGLHLEALSDPVPTWGSVPVVEDSDDSDGNAASESGDSDDEASGLVRRFRALDVQFEQYWDALTSGCVSERITRLLGGDKDAEGMEDFLTWTALDLPDTPESAIDLKVPSASWMGGGWCSLVVVVNKRRDEAAAKMGVWPSVDALLRLNKEWLSFFSFTRALCVPVAAGKLHVYCGTKEEGTTSLFDELVCAATAGAEGFPVGSFGQMLRDLHPGDVFGSAVCTVSVETLLGARVSSAKGAVYGSAVGAIGRRVESALVSSAVSKAAASMPPSVSVPLRGDFSQWSTTGDARLRPFAIFPVPVEVSGLTFPGVMWFDPAVPVANSPVFFLGAPGKFAGELTVDVDVRYANAAVYKTASWKLLPVLLGNALHGGSTFPKPSFPTLGLPWATGGLGEHFSVLADAWLGMFSRVRPVGGDGFLGSASTAGPLALEPISGGLYSSFPGCFGVTDPDCYVPPVHTWDNVEGVPIGALAMRWRQEHL